MSNVCWAVGCENETLVEYCHECVMNGGVKPVPKNPQLENNFSYHAPKEGQPEKYEQIRAKAKELAYLIDAAVPNSREKALAHTNLEQAVFWANAGIARNE